MASPEIQFIFNEDAITLEAVVEVSSEKDQIITTQWFQEQMAANGHDKLELIKDGIVYLVNEINTGEAEQRKAKVARKKDAEIIISVSKDKMEAYLTIHTALGGQPATLNSIKTKLAEQSLRNGLIAEEIKQAIANGQADRVIIAIGDPIINGEDARFECLLPEVKVRTPKIAENGNVDYRDLGEIMIVHEGEKLMKRTPATAGAPSKNVLGAIVNPVPGKDTPYAAGLVGVEISKKEPGVLIATATGQPIIQDCGVSVESTMSVKMVNLASGNILFDGSVIIEGDVEHGMKVEVTGDINVLGMVESANLKAGGDIVIQGAIVGRGAVRESNGQLNPETAIIRAKGSISAKFTENAYLDAGNNIFIQDWVVKSELTAFNEAIIGNKNTKKGQIIGGKVTSGILVKAMNIGSNAGVTTEVQVGTAVDVDKELDTVSRAITKIRKTLKELQKSISILKSNPTKQAQDRLKKILFTRKSMEKDFVNKQEQKRKIETEILRAQNAKLTIAKTIYSGVKISVGGIAIDIDEDLGKRSFIIVDGQLAQTQD